MSNATITRLQAERETQATFVSELLAAVEKEGRDLVDAEKQNIDNAEKRMLEIDAQLEPLVRFEERRAAAVVVSDRGRPPVSPGGNTGSAPADTRSLGQRWVESEEFRSYSGRGSSRILEIPEFRALVTTSTAAAMVPPENQYRQPLHIGPLPLLSLVGRIEVSSNAVEIVTVSDASTGADVVAEGAQKPEVTWTTSASTVTLQTIAGWSKYTRQTLQDIPAMRDVIDQKIRRSIDLRLNTLASTALGTAFSGGNSTTGASGVSLLTLIRGAVADLQVRGIQPTAVLLNPADYAALDIEMLGKPLGAATINGSFFGLVPVPVPSLAAGTAIVGDVGDGLTWFYKAGLSLYTTDSDITGAGSTAASDFRANILTTLGEVRGIFAVTDASVLQRVIVTP
jgi:HK97 family phage major capsid protein